MTQETTRIVEAEVLSWTDGMGLGRKMNNRPITWSSTINIPALGSIISWLFLACFKADSK